MYSNCLKKTSKVYSQKEIDEMLNVDFPSDEEKKIEEQEQSAAVKLLEKISKDFDNLASAYSELFECLYGPLNFEEVEEYKVDKDKVEKLTENIFNYTKILSKDVGKLDDVLSKNPPKKANDVNSSNKHLKKCKNDFNFLNQTFEDINENERTKKLNHYHKVMQITYHSLKVKIDIYNSKSKEKLQTLEEEQ